MGDERETYERNGLTVTIYNDPEAESPREWDNFGTMICSHQRYNLGDTQLVKDNFNSWGEVAEWLRKTLQAAIVLPLGLYDHSGISIYVGETHDRWDGGQVGFIYCTREQVDNEFNGDMDKAEACLRGEVETYNKYLNGEVYGFQITDRFGNDIESCWGFYDIEECRNDANSMADSYQPEKTKPINYTVFKDLFKALDINPFPFKQEAGDKVNGWFPQLPNRKGNVNVKALAKVLWGNE